MARPKKYNAEYFTHDADMRNDVKIKALRRKFSHTGYAVWNYLLETLTDSDFFEVEWEEINIELLAADYDVSVEELTEIVEYCVKIGLLQLENDVLRSDAHQNRFRELLDNRVKKSEAGKKGMAKRWGQNDNIVIENDNSVITPLQKTITENNKGEESKVKESKVKYPYQDIVDAWNATCKNLPKVSKLSDARRKKIKCRLQEFGEPYSWMPTIESLFEAVAASDFLRGVNKNSWAATFDWLFSNETNWVKVMEGNYANKGQAQRSPAGQNLGVGERIENGRRTYGTGTATIPMSAPPRPSDRYAWNSESQNWIML